MFTMGDKLVSSSDLFKRRGLQPARSFRQLREGFTARFARSAPLLLKALQASVNRLTRAAQLFSDLVSCGTSAKERQQPRLFVRQPRTRHNAIVRHPQSPANA
jgi:hypothetical protein